MDDILDKKTQKGKYASYIMGVAGVTMASAGTYYLATNPKSGYGLLDGVITTLGVSYFTLAILSLYNKKEKKNELKD